MHMVRRVTSLGFPLFAGALYAQQILQPTDEFPVNGVANTITVGATRCDANGDIYLRVASAPDITHERLTRIGRNGSISTFDLETLADSTLRGLRLQDFAIVEDSVWLLASASSKSAERNYALQFDRQGTYKTAVEFQGDFYLEQIAVFPAGNFLASGSERTGSGQEPALQTMTALFDPTGKLLARVQIEREHQAGKEKAGDSNEVSREITLGTAESYGGEIYILKASANPEILVISASGTVARRFAFEPPFSDAGTANMRVVQGQIVVEFLRPKEGATPAKPGAPVFFDATRSLYLVYDAFTGDKLAIYSRDPALQGQWACFDGRGGFEFLGESESGLRKIIKAGAR